MQPDMIASALHALQLLLEPARLLILFVGVVIGLAIGVLPGLNGIVGMAMLIPFTYNLDEYTAFALLLGMAAVITSSDFITAVLFGVPGHVGAAATVIDGHAMARKGEAGRAFGAGFAASLAGGIVGAIVLAVSIPILRPVMLSIGSPELLAFTLFGMSMVATLSGRAPLKGLTAAGLGLMIAMIGSRAQSGTLRWTFGWLYLWDGMPLIPATLGIFALPELAELAVSRKRIAGDNAPNINMSSQWEGVRDVVRHWWLVLRCGVLGTGLGAIPGIGSAVIDWIAYGYAQRTEKNPETFGSGDVRGVIAPESSNNSKEGGHLVPTIAFGVPAGASMAILLGAFLMHGLTPGPDMLTKHLDLTYLIVWSLTLAHVIGAIICLGCSRWLAQVSRIRPEILLPVIIALVFVAAFEGEHDWGDLYSLLFFGVVGWIMKRLGWPRPPMVLGLVVGRDFRALSVHLDPALRMGLAVAAGGAGDSRRRRLGAVSAAVADRDHAGRAISRSRRSQGALRCGAGLLARHHRAHRRGDDLVDGMAARRQAGAAHRLQHGAHRRRAQSHQRAVRSRAKSRFARRLRHESERACAGSWRCRRCGAVAGDDFFRLDGRLHRAGCSDRIHPRDRRVRLRLYALRLRRTVADRARLCRGDDPHLLCGVPLGAGGRLAAGAPWRIVSGFARGDAVVLTLRGRSSTAPRPRLSSRSPAAFGKRP